MKLVSAFPGLGKTYLSQISEKVTDSYHSNFLWNIDGTQNVEWPKNYLSHLNEVISTSDLVLVSPLQIVRDLLKENGFIFVLCYPDLMLKDEFLQRYINRNASQEFIQLMLLRWEDWLKECRQQVGCIHIQTNSGEYLSNYVELIKSLTI